MTSKDGFDDDYVARLLAEDAKKISSKYASQGLSAFLPKKRAADAPKPNTRFLSHIVREADSHNAALKRKEELEAERRLKALREADERPAKRRRADETDASKRSRMLKDIFGAASSKKTGESDRNVERRKRKSSDDRTEEGRGSRKPSHDQRSSKSERRSRHNRPKSRDRVKQHSSRHHSSSASESENPSQQEAREEKVVTTTTKQRSKPKRRSRSPEASSTPEVIRVRGRGAHKHKSAIDEHFKEGYDPSQDVSLDSSHDSDAEDWGMALEAMRDRAKYKRSQASRMRDAGFSEQDITKWKKGQSGGEGDISAVKWKAKGEVREWDAGK